MNEFSMEDVKEIVFNAIIAAYTEKKQMIAHIQTLEEKIKNLEPDSENKAPSMD